MIFKANRGGAVGCAVLQIGAEAWNLPALSFLSWGSAQSSCALLCSQSSSYAPLLARLPPQQSNLGRHRGWSFPHSCQDAISD